MTTVAPAEAKPFAMPSPMPPFPPVMNATRFCKSKIVIAGFLRIQQRIDERPTKTARVHGSFG
jgi:hypothetical protein